MLAAAAVLAGARSTAADIQAGVTMLGRRELPPGGLQVLDLTRVDLQGAQLSRANLQGGWLIGTDLQGAQLDEASLQLAALDGADLQGARATEATRRPRGWDRAQAEARGIQYTVNGPY